MKNTFFILILNLLIQYVGAQENTTKFYSDQALAQLEKNKVEDALKTLSEGINNMPDSSSLYNLRGSILDALGYFQYAIDDFTIASQLTDKPKYLSEILSNLGASQYNFRKFDDAYTTLVKAVELNPNNLAALNNLAMICDEINKPEESIEFLNEIISVDPKYVPAYVNLGFRHQNMDKHQEAVTYFNKAIELDPKQPLAYSNLSFSLYKLNDLKGALKAVNRSLSLFPSNSYAYKIRALIYIANDQLEKACEDLDMAEQLNYKVQYGDEVQELKKEHCK